LRKVFRNPREDKNKKILDNKNKNVCVNLIKMAKLTIKKAIIS